MPLTSIIMPFFILVCSFIPGYSQHQKENQTPCIILGATLHKNGNEEIIQNGALAWKKGKIILLADARLIRIDLSKYDVMQLNGHHIYPLTQFASLDLLKQSDWEISQQKWDKATKQDNPLEEGSEASFLISNKAKAKHVNPDDVKFIYIRGEQFNLNKH